MKPHELRTEIMFTESRLRTLREQLESAERNCRHRWGAVQYVPDERKGYQFAGDPPGTMGVDRQLPCYIPAQTTPKWSRMCLDCGKEQTTTRTTQKRVAGSIPGTSGAMDVPDFGDRW